MLKLIQRVRGYKLNIGAFSTLRDLGLPISVLDTLLHLQDKHYLSKEQFIHAIQAGESGISVARYMAHILNAARILQRRRIGAYIKSRWVTYCFMYLPKSRFTPSIYQYVMLWPVVVSLRLRARWFFFTSAAKMRNRSMIQRAANTNVSGFMHNYKQVLCFFSGHRTRTEGLMNVLRTIRSVNPGQSKLLCIGPRNEGEILLFSSYGFFLRNIEAIDLFSYSPLIKVMDMNALKFKDDSFDIYYSSAVITYSPNIALTVAESIRVTKPGGLMAISFGGAGKSDLIPTGSELKNLNELFSLYKGYVDYVFWQEECSFAADVTQISVIFRLKK